jgi:hypothetical protein
VSSIHFELTIILISFQPARTVYGLEPEVNYASSSSNMGAPMGPYYSYPLAEPSYAPPPFGDMTAATNLFPQTLPASLEFPPLYDNVDATPSMGSGLGFVAMADPAYNTLDATTGNFDYHSSDHIFDSFNASFGFSDSAY